VEIDGEDKYLAVEYSMRRSAGVDFSRTPAALRKLLLRGNEAAIAFGPDVADGGEAAVWTGKLPTWGEIALPAAASGLRRSAHMAHQSSNCYLRNGKLPLVPKNVGTEGVLAGSISPKI